jgi:hypothetical protein
MALHVSTLSKNMGVYDGLDPVTSPVASFCYIKSKTTETIYIYFSMVAITISFIFQHCPRRSCPRSRRIRDQTRRPNPCSPLPPGPDPASSCFLFFYMYYPASCPTGCLRWPALQYSTLIKKKRNFPHI